MTENRSYYYIQGQGQGHTIPRWTCLVTLHSGLLNGGG